MKADSRSTYRILVQGRYGDDGCYQTFWCVADHFGEAIGLAAEAASNNDIRQPVPCKAYWTDEIPEEAIEEAENVFSESAIHLFPYRRDDDTLQFPCGVIPSDSGGDPDPDDIVEAYGQDLDVNPLTIEVVVDRRNLRSTFLKLIERLPSASALEVRICGHWDDSRKTGVWLSPDWNSHESVSQYIIDRERNLLLNGHVELGIYCRKEKCTLRLHDHKIIAFYCEDSRYLERYMNTVNELGFNQVDSLLSIAYGFHHNHYRPAGSLDRVDLIESLEADGFRHVESIDDEEEYDTSPEEES